MSVYTHARQCAVHGVYSIYRMILNHTLKIKILFYSYNYDKKFLYLQASEVVA